MLGDAGNRSSGRSMRHFMRMKPGLLHLSLAMLMLCINFVPAAPAQKLVALKATPAAPEKKKANGPPGYPTHIRATAGDRMVTISWDRPSHKGGAKILSYTVSDLLEEKVVRVAGDPPATAAIVTGLVNGHEYAFKVVAENKFGKGQESLPSSSVSPFHSTNLCDSVSCSGHGICSPNYELRRGLCICRTGYGHSDDCSTAAVGVVNDWSVGDWSSCSETCGTGERTRTVHCGKFHRGRLLGIESNATKCEVHAGSSRKNKNDAKRPPVTEPCNVLSCDEDKATAVLVLDSSYSEISFSAHSQSAVLRALTAELARALQLPTSNIFFDSQRSVSGSVALTFDITAPDSTRSIDGVVANLTAQARNSHSPLLTYGTWGPLIISASSKIFHSTNMCEHVLCSGHGTCFPDYSQHTDRRQHAHTEHAHVKESKKKQPPPGRQSLRHWMQRGKGVCVCQEGYTSDDSGDCAKLIPGPAYSWNVGKWSYCSAGCNGGTRTRKVTCGRYLNGELVGEEEDLSKCENEHTPTPKPADSERCQLLACGEDYAHVILFLELDLAALTFSGKAVQMFVQSFIAEIAGALYISQARIMISAVLARATRTRKHNTKVVFDILPGSNADSVDVADVLETLQTQVNNHTSELRTMGSWGRFINSDASEGFLKIATDVPPGLHEKISLKFIVITILVLVLGGCCFGYFVVKVKAKMFKLEKQRSRVSSDDVSEILEATEMRPMHIE